MAGVTIPNVQIKNCFGQRWRTPRRDADGAVIFKNGCEVCLRPREGPLDLEMEDATVATLLRELLLSFSSSDYLRSSQKPMDGRNAQKLWNQLDSSQGESNISLHQDQYDWLHRILAREVPSPGQEARPVATILYGLSDYCITEQLLSPTTGGDQGSGGRPVAEAG